VCVQPRAIGATSSPGVSPHDGAPRPERLHRVVSMDHGLESTKKVRRLPPPCRTLRRGLRGSLLFTPPPYLLYTPPHEPTESSHLWSLEVGNEWIGKPRQLRGAISGPNREPRSQNVKRMLSERETFVELPWAADSCPCVVSREPCYQYLLV
jgi:hypothetical protein